MKILSPQCGLCYKTGTQRGVENLKSSLRHQLHPLCAGCLSSQLSTLLISGPAPRTMPNSFSNTDCINGFCKNKGTLPFFYFWVLEVTPPCNCPQVLKATNLIESIDHQELVLFLIAVRQEFCPHLYIMMMI